MNIALATLLHNRSQAGKLDGRSCLDGIEMSRGIRAIEASRPRAALYAPLAR